MTSRQYTIQFIWTRTLLTCGLSQVDEVVEMPQGHRKLTAKRPKDVVVRADKQKLNKQTPKMKKGGNAFALPLYSDANFHLNAYSVFKPTLFEEYTKILHPFEFQH